MGMNQPKWTVYKDKAREWRWRFVSTNGNVMADSGEGYKRRKDCESALDIFKQAAWTELLRKVRI